MELFKKKIILASQSPRRSQLLRSAGFNFEVKLSDTEVEETYPADLPVEAVAAFLAEKKAAAAFHLIENDEILLTADSIVHLEDTIFGKPRDYDDAFQILSRLSGRAHEVITGVCLWSKKKKVTFSGYSRVFFEQLSPKEIDYYIKNYQPWDKAGAYAIQEWIGLCKVSKIEGTYTNIMGLPVELVYRHLLRDFAEG